MLLLLLFLRQQRIFEASSDEYDRIFRINAAISKKLTDANHNQNIKLFEFNKLIELSRLSYKPNRNIDVEHDIKITARTGNKVLFTENVEIFDERGVDITFEPIYVKEIEIEVEGDINIGEINFYKNDELLNEISTIFEDYTYTSIKKGRNTSRVLELYANHPTKNIYSNKISYLNRIMADPIGMKDSAIEVAQFLESNPRYNFFPKKILL